MLRAEDVTVGMRVDPKDLWDIVGVAFILTNFEGNIGEVVYKGEPYTEESTLVVKKLQDEGKDVCTFYEPYDGEEVSWDE